MNSRMNENFEKLKVRTVEALSDSDLERINYELSKINSPTILTGVGGSKVVSTFACEVINRKNNIITVSKEPRSIKYVNLVGFNNILSCSYSGNNYGVKMAFLNNLKHYLLSSKENDDKDIVNLTYTCQDEEHSFISLAATLIPCSILLNYYLDNNSLRVINSIIDNYDFNFDITGDIYEIFTGVETKTASIYLESTMVESGIGIPIVHDKYSFCHGRSTLSTVNESIAIYFNNNTELDNLLISEIIKYYKQVVIIDYNKDVIGQYDLLVKCMYLTKYIALNKDKDLSKVEYSPMTKKLYRYNGLY